MTAAQTYRAHVGSQQIDLPIIPVAERVAISLLMTIDAGLAFNETAGRELAELIADSRPECVVSAATLGIPVAIEVSRALGLDDYVILQKTEKIHLADSLREDLSSITTSAQQQLLLDRRRLDAVRGRRVAFVDDVISSGQSVAAALRLLDQAGAEVVAIGAYLAEGDAHRAVLGERSTLVRTLGTIPLFDLDVQGVWVARS